MVNHTAPSLRLVSYERVSTAGQGLSGLGLEAQRKAIDEFAETRSAQVLARFTEVESDRKIDRPELAKALNVAKLTGATLVIANLDRLSRNAAFLLTLRDSGVRFLKPFHLSLNRLGIPFSGDFWFVPFRRIRVCAVLVQLISAVPAR